MEIKVETITIRVQDIPIPQRCENCPYPHVGFTCRDRNGSDCLRTDVERITERQKRTRKLDLSC